MITHPLKAILFTQVIFEQQNLKYLKGKRPAPRLPERAITRNQGRAYRRILVTTFGK